MKDEPDRPPLYIWSAEKIKDHQRRRALLRAVHERWPQIVMYSDAELRGAMEPDILLDRVVGDVGLAKTKGPVQDYGAYLFKSFVNEARKLLRRASKIEYLDPADLAVHPAASDTSSVEKLERKILTQEALAVLDDRTRKICVLWSQGFKHKDIAAVLGISAKAVQKQFERGIERMRRHIQDGPKNEPGPIN